MNNDNLFPRRALDYPLGTDKYDYPHFTYIPHYKIRAKQKFEQIS